MERRLEIDGKTRNILSMVNTMRKYKKKPIVVKAIQILRPFKVQTKEGIMSGKPGDYLIMGIEGEFYPCDKDIFKKTYEGVQG